MKHIFLIDPLEKLTIKKDSSLLLAHAAQEAGLEVYILFVDDLYFSNDKSLQLKLYSFNAELETDSCYLHTFKLLKGEIRQVTEGDCLHMRIDPPFNLKYLHTLWLLSGIEHMGVKIVNRPQGILTYNEKIMAYSRDRGIASWVGTNFESAEQFISKIQSEQGSLFILKPLDLFQGIGVEKFDFSGLTTAELKAIFINKKDEFAGPVVVQPFIKEVSLGEIRSIFFDGHLIGSILKVPVQGEYLANIAQGAQFEKVELSPSLQQRCKVICDELSQVGVSLVAFDILADTISEVNITCPGLLVEVSHAYKRNLAVDIINSDYFRS